MEVGYGFDWRRNERDGKFDELAAALICVAVISLLLAFAYLVTFAVSPMVIAGFWTPGAISRLRSAITRHDKSIDEIAHETLPPNLQHSIERLRILHVHVL